MKVIGFNGSPHENGNTALAMNIVFEELCVDETLVRGIDLKIDISAARPKLCDKSKHLSLVLIVLNVKEISKTIAIPIRWVRKDKNHLKAELQELGFGPKRKTE